MSSLLDADSIGRSTLATTARSTSAAHHGDHYCVLPTRRRRSGSDKKRPYPSADLAGRARALFAQLVHAEASDVALTPSTNYAMSARRKLSRCAADSVVVLEDQMSSNVLPWQARCHEGAELESHHGQTSPGDLDGRRDALHCRHGRGSGAALLV